MTHSRPAPVALNGNGPRIGLALGGGGAKGLAHIPILEVFDELGTLPCMIAGTSIGAILGALYAAGMPAVEIRRGIEQLMAEPQSWKQIFESKPLFAWLEFIDIEIGRSSLLKADTFLKGLAEAIGVERFEDLPVPLKVVATDFWARDEVVYDSGPIIPAIAASFAIPGIFKPQLQDGRVLVDGGCVNPVPYDLLLDHCDIVVAVDVMGKREPGEDLIPSYTDTVFNGLQIAEKAILREKFKAHPPDIFVDVEIRDVRVLDFHKTARVYEQTEAAVKFLRAQLPLAIEQFQDRSRKKPHRVKAAFQHLRALVR